MSFIGCGSLNWEKGLGEMKSFSLDCKWVTGFLSLSSGLNL